MHLYWLSSMTKTASTLSADSLTELKDFSSLLSKTRAMTSSSEDSPQEDYFSTKEKALGYVYDGYIRSRPYLLLIGSNRPKIQ